jgi:hypothetical protein
MSLALVVEILGDATGLDKSLKGASGSVGGFGDLLGGSTLKVAALAGGVTLAAGAIVEMTAAAAADRDEQAKLETVLKAAGVATGDYTDKVDAAIEAGQARAFSDSETRDALASLVTATHDLDTATSSLALAQDVARFAGVDLATAADAVAKAQAGQAGPLAKLIPGLDKGANATETLANATKAAAGQADTFASSVTGMGARGADALGELGEEVGSAFLPILDALLPVLIQLIQLLGQLIKAVLPAIIPILKLLGSALKVVGDILVIVVGWIVKLVKWLGDAIGVLGRFLDAINPLKGITLPSLPFLSASTSSAAGPGVGRSSSRAASTGAVAPASITIYTTGDGIEAEQAVVRALRRVTRLNGGVVPAVGWAGG